MGAWAFELRMPTMLDLIAAGGAPPLFPATLEVFARGPSSAGEDLDLGEEAETLLRGSQILQEGARRSVSDKTAWLMAEVSAVGHDEEPVKRSLVRRATESQLAAGRVWATPQVG